jgi:hypothetical protein
MTSKFGFPADAGIAVILAFCISCGGGNGDVLATVGNVDLTENDFRDTFDNLSPEEQVRVLEPGGRMNLMNRIVHRTLLEMASEDASPSRSDTWVRLYSDAWLASEWLSAASTSFRNEPDAIDSMLLSRSFSLSIVLLEDSADAQEVVRQWNLDSPSEPGCRMVLAPWSSGESSFAHLGGLLLQLPVDLFFFFGEHDGEGAVAVPVYGVWAVGDFEITELDSTADIGDAGTSVFFGRYLSESLRLELNSLEIERFGAGTSLVDGSYVFLLPDSPGSIVVSWDGGELDAQELYEILSSVQDHNFFEGVPTELASFAAPSPRLTPELDLWFCVSRYARTMLQAQLSAEDGRSVPSSVISQARAENLLRTVILEPLSRPDSAEVLEFYSEHIDGYLLPERRSVLMVYVDADRVPELSGASSFDVLGEYQTMFDSEGEMKPTPLQSREVYGDLLGDEIFSSSLNAFSGPVIPPDGAFAVYFQVVSIEPPTAVQPGEIWGVLKEAYRASRVQEELDEYLLELWSEYNVEIDSNRVMGIDPWTDIY